MYWQRGNYGCESTCTPIAMNGKLNFLYFLYDHKKLNHWKYVYDINRLLCLGFVRLFRAYFCWFYFFISLASLVGSSNFLGSIVVSLNSIVVAKKILLRAFVHVVRIYTCSIYVLPGSIFANFLATFHFYQSQLKWNRVVKLMQIFSARLKSRTCPGSSMKTWMV